MKQRKSQSGFILLESILIIVLLGILGFVGWKAYQARQSAGNLTLSSDKHASTAPSGVIEYKNTDLGFKFTYPKTWGNASVSNNKVAFSNNNKVIIEPVTKDNSSHPAGAGDSDNCAGNGLDRQIVSPATLKASNQFQNGTVAGSKVYSSFLAKGTDYYVQEAYEYYPPGVSGGIGICPGYTVVGAKVFSAKSRLTGVAFEWYQYGTDCCTNRPSQAEYEVFVQDKNSVLSSIEKQKIVELVKSLTEL